MPPLKVIQWATGYTGKYALGYILDNPHLQLVGVRCYSEDKVGLDAGELIGRAPAGVALSNDRDALLALDADCVVFMPQDVLSDPSIAGSPSAGWVDDLEAILASGKNVISSVCTGTHWRHLANGDAFRDRLDAACAAGGGTTVHFSGFDPGFTTDALAFTLASVVGAITQIRTWEIIDVSTYPAVTTLQQLGFGARPEDIPPEGLGAITVGWGGALHVLADALGVVVDDITLDADFSLAPHGFTTPAGLPISEGTIAALSWKLTGLVEGNPKFVINHITRATADMAPDWESIGSDGGYRVEIDGFPPFRGDFPMGLPGGTGSSFSDAMAMTAARCVNSIEPVVHAPTGYQTFLALAPLGGRYALTK
jgi:2,4-diaminopentanoate dehydrogenase